ncbi:MAG: PCP reductase family protein [Nitrospirales bacterium]
MVFARFHCVACEWTVGAEGSLKEMDFLIPAKTWSDEARYHLSRMPPYLAGLVRDEVEAFAQEQHFTVLTYARLVSARNKGMVEWSSDAERRLANVPSGIRTMAKTELERTALDRGMPEVTVALMEEVKTRYFGMATRLS